MCLLVAAGGKTQGNASLAWSTHFGVEGHKSSDKPQHSVKSLGNGCGQVPGSLLHSKAVVKRYVGQHSMGQCPGVVHKYSLQDNVQRMGGGSCFRTLLTEGTKLLVTAAQSPSAKLVWMQGSQHITAWKQSSLYQAYKKVIPNHENNRKKSVL